MAENSAIPWTNHTFNPWIGCTKVGPGCDNCYAEKERCVKILGVKWGAGQPRHRTAKSTWKQPAKWNRAAAKSGKRVKVFCASLADVFDNEVPQKWRDDLWLLIKATSHLSWIIVTKRIGNVAAMLPGDWGLGYPNVCLMITVVNQEEADRDIPKFLNIPALTRGLSIEPQLGLIVRLDNAIDWVICGAESGPNARPFDEYWARALRDQCTDSGVGFFYKQNFVNGKKIETPMLDGRRWVEFPCFCGLW